MTPSLNYCTQQCLFCWRAQSSDLKAHWDETKFATSDSPENIVDESVKAQLKILSGYKGIRTYTEKVREAATPRHVAISLTGEPTLYPQISEPIQAYRKRGFITFLSQMELRPHWPPSKKSQRSSTFPSAPRRSHVQACLPPTNTKGMRETERNAVPSTEPEVSHRGPNDLGQRREHEQCGRLQ